MSTDSSSVNLTQGSDCKDAFKAAYENRYTWEPGFSGYQGKCIREEASFTHEGTFKIEVDFKVHVEGIKDELIHKAISSQLWEFCTHRKRRSFNDTHRQNSFTAGESDALGTEIFVGGQNAGDRYRIRKDVITMIQRYFYGTVVLIFIEEIMATGNGYLARKYNSQYLDPATRSPISGISHFTDTFVALKNAGPWVLSERKIKTDAHIKITASSQLFRFVDLNID